MIGIICDGPNGTQHVIKLLHLVQYLGYGFTVVGPQAIVDD